MMMWGETPETGTAPLGVRFLLVTEAHENGCEENQRRSKVKVKVFLLQL